VSDLTSFELSRVYAEGWKAARKYLMDGSNDDAAAQVDSLNPYLAGPERVRWGAGFEAALQQRPRGR
jgi:hypothetical protein